MQTTSGKWIPWAIVAFFATFITILSGLAWIAFHTYTGEVTANAYNKGLAYNSSLAKAAEQEKLGWQGELSTRLQGHSVNIAFTLKDAAGRMMNDAQVMAQLKRPTQAGHDQKVVLHADGNGTYRASAGLEWPGVWQLRVSATEDGHNYQQSKTIVLQ